MKLHLKAILTILVNAIPYFLFSQNENDQLRSFLESYAWRISVNNDGAIVDRVKKTDVARLTGKSGQELDLFSKWGIDVSGHYLLQNGSCLIRIAPWNIDASSITYAKKTISIQNNLWYYEVSFEGNGSVESSSNPYSLCKLILKTQSIETASKIVKLIKQVSTKAKAETGDNTETDNNYEGFGKQEPENFVLSPYYGKHYAYAKRSLTPGPSSKWSEWEKVDSGYLSIEITSYEKPNTSHWSLVDNQIKKDGLYTAKGYKVSISYKGKTGEDFIEYNNGNWSTFTYFNNGIANLNGMNMLDSKFDLEGKVEAIKDQPKFNISDYAFSFKFKYSDKYIEFAFKNPQSNRKKENHVE